MNFAQIPAKASVFLDANILVYFFGPDPVFGPECQLLIDRVFKYQDFHAVTSTHGLSEMAHQLMVLEAMTLFGWPAAGITRRLRRHPDDVQKLNRFQQAIDEVPRLGIEVLPVEPHLVPMAAGISKLHGLLSNDALTTAIMQDQAITHLVSHDTDFDRVPGLTGYAPA